MQSATIVWSGGEAYPQMNGCQKGAVGQWTSTLTPVSVCLARLRLLTLKYAKYLVPDDTLLARGWARLGESGSHLLQRPQLPLHLFSRRRRKLPGRRRRRTVHEPGLRFSRSQEHGFQRAQLPPPPRCPRVRDRQQRLAPGRLPHQWR